MSETSGEEVFSGSNGDLAVTDDAVIIRRGAKGFLRSGTVRGEKRIPFRHITSVQWLARKALQIS